MIDGDAEAELVGDGDGVGDGALDEGGAPAVVRAAGASPPHADAATATTTTSTGSRSGRGIAAMLRGRIRPPGSIRAVGDWDLTPKPVSASQVVLSQLMEITDANIMGIVHGGVVMKLVDTSAGLAAIKHIGGLAVTVAMDEMSFLAPVRIGDMVSASASVNDVGETSLEVGVRVESENVVTGERTHASSAYLVFVGLDANGKPRPVPPVVAETPEQLRRQREARIRRTTRLAHKQAIRENRRGEG